MRIGFGYDVHAFTPGRPLWLGGIAVPHTQGLLGHSDADVAIHALCDGAQSMRPEEFTELAGKVRAIRAVVK